MRTERYGRLEYIKSENRYEIIDSFNGDRIPVMEGDAVTIGHLMGHTIRAIPFRDGDGWSWCVSKLPRLKPPFDGVVSIREK